MPGVRNTFKKVITVLYRDIQQQARLVSILEEREKISKKRQNERGTFCGEEVQTSWCPRYFILLLCISSDRSRNLVRITH